MGGFVMGAFEKQWCELHICAFVQLHILTYKIHIGPFEMQ